MYIVNGTYQWYMVIISFVIQTFFVFIQHCKEVLGVELMDANVEDAKRLATKNGLENCEFMQGKIDDVFPKLAEKVKGKKVVPILDPPRVGISK